MNWIDELFIGMVLSITVVSMIASFGLILGKYQKSITKAFRWLYKAFKTLMRCG